MVCSSSRHALVSIEQGGRVLFFVGLVLLLGMARRAPAQSVRSYNLTETVDRPRSVTTADIDGDGLLDVLVALQGADQVVWFRNLPNDPLFGGARVVADSVPGAAAVETGDFDADGDPDVVVAAYEANRVVWYDNRGGSAASRFPEGRVIDDSLNGPIDLDIADLDSDGQPDVLATAFLGDRVVWYENRQGQVADGFADPTLIGEDVDGPRSVTAATLDGGGAPDVLVASQDDGTIGWFKSGTFGGIRPLLQSAAAPRSVATGDLDGDGDPDVVGVDDNDVMWFENRAPGGFGAAQVIGAVDQGKDVAVADLDGDGDLDVGVTSGGDDTIAWIENRVDQGEGFAAPSPLTTQADGALGVHAADLDGDGFTDVLGAVSLGNRVVAFFNRGLGAPPPPQPPTAQPYREEAARITWSAQPPQDGAGYRLYRATDSFATAGAATLVGPDPLPDTTYIDSSLDASEVYHYRVRAVDDAGNESALSAPDTVKPRVPEPRTPTGVSAERDGRVVTLRWAANEEVDLAGYRVYRARSPVAAPEEANRIYSGGTGTRQVTDTLEIGGTIHYGVTAVDREGNESPVAEAAPFFFYPETVSVEVDRAFSGNFRAEEYRLVALPGAVARPLGPTVEGTPDVDWTALWDDGTQEDPFVRYDGSDTFTFRPGRGFWLLGRSAWRVRDAVPSVSLRGDSVTVIDLHDGWNIISNPLEKDVLWRTVDAAHKDTLQTPWAFDRGFEQTALFRSARSGQAYYFLNRTGLDSLRIPYPGAPPASLRSKTAAPPPTLALTATQGDQAATAQVRLRAAARSGLDPYDQFAPTARFEPLRFALDAPAASPRRTHLAEAAVPPAGSGHAFDLTLDTDSDAPVRIRASGLEGLPWRHAVLTHTATGRRYDLRAEPSISVKADTGETAFALRVGTAAFVAKNAGERVAPATVTLSEPRPNPFRRETTLSYTLPEPSRVRVVVHDLLGRRVATLLDDRQDAGAHQVAWQPARRASIASGVYFLRVRAGNVEKTRKVVRLR
jgi:hypothetical protein